MEFISNSKNQADLFLASRKGQNAIAFLFLLFFFVFNVLSVQDKDKTYDEPGHYQYGKNILNGDSTRFDDSKMPISAWNALPAKVVEIIPFPDGLVKAYLPKLITARLMTTLFSVIVAFMVFYWARELYGFIPSLISIGLYILDPNIIAHSQLVTTDIYVTGMILFSSYWLWKFAYSRKWQDGIWFAIMLGIAQLTKYTAFSLYSLYAIAFIVYDWPSIKKVFETGRWGAVRGIMWQYVKYAIVVVIISIAIINIGFLFNRTFTSFSDYDFRSNLFKSIQSKTSFAVPVPYPYLEGLDWVLDRERTNTGFGGIYLLGELRFGKGFPGYYFIASLLKVPIATQIVLLAAFSVYLSDWDRREKFFSNEWFLLWSVLFYTIYFNFLYRAQIGIRYYLVVFPLLYVFAGGLFTNWRGFGWKQKWTVFTLSLYLIVSVISYFPYYISYFNEIIWDRKMAYRYLADSNLDWGQDALILSRFRVEHPDVHRAPEKPELLTKTTRYFVYVNQLVGITKDPQVYEWLRDNFEPVDMITPSCLLFEITPEQMQDLCQRTSYCTRE